MNKQAEIEQAYWNGFRTKCAEYGVDATKLARSIPRGFWDQRLGASQPDAPLWKRTLSAIPAGANAATSAVVGAVAGPALNAGYKLQANRYRRQRGLPTQHGPAAAWRNTVDPVGPVRQLHKSAPGAL